jgi:hypothetical protein
MMLMRDILPIPIKSPMTIPMRTARAVILTVTKAPTTKRLKYGFIMEKSRFMSATAPLKD